MGFPRETRVVIDKRAVATGQGSCERYALAGKRVYGFATKPELRAFTLESYRRLASQNPAPACVWIEAPVTAPTEALVFPARLDAPDQAPDLEPWIGIASRGAAGSVFEGHATTTAAHSASAPWLSPVECGLRGTPQRPRVSSSSPPRGKVASRRRSLTR